MRGQAFALRYNAPVSRRQKTLPRRVLKRFSDGHPVTLSVGSNASTDRCNREEGHHVLVPTGSEEVRGSSAAGRGEQNTGSSPSSTSSIFFGLSLLAKLDAGIGAQMLVLWLATTLQPVDDPAIMGGNGPKASRHESQRVVDADRSRAHHRGDCPLYLDGDRQQRG